MATDGSAYVDLTPRSGRIINSVTDLGVFPCVFHYHLSPGLRHLLPDHSGQEH